jgi:uncharacterized protein (DUF1810 family)
VPDTGASNRRQNEGTDRRVPDAELDRFLLAQRDSRHSVVAELTAGRKRSHWIWFVFPQLAGLGRSATAQRYAIGNLEEARRYLDEPTLGQRLRADVGLVMRHRDKSAHEIFGSPDDLKFRSCLTLFREASVQAHDRDLFTAALDQFYGGKADIRTLELLGSADRE